MPTAPIRFKFQPENADLRASVRLSLEIRPIEPVPLKIAPQAPERGVAVPLSVDLSQHQAIRLEIRPESAQKQPLSVYLDPELSTRRDWIKLPPPERSDHVREQEKKKKE